MNKATTAQKSIHVNEIFHRKRVLLKLYCCFIFVVLYLTMSRRCHEKYIFTVELLRPPTRRYFIYKVVP